MASEKLNARQKNVGPVHDSDMIPVRPEANEALPSECNKIHQPVVNELIQKFSSKEDYYDASKGEKQKDRGQTEDKKEVIPFSIEVKICPEETHISPFTEDSSSVQPIAVSLKDGYTYSEGSGRKKTKESFQTQLKHKGSPGRKTSSQQYKRTTETDEGLYEQNDINGTNVTLKRQTGVGNSKLRNTKVTTRNTGEEENDKSDTTYQEQKKFKQETETLKETAEKHTEEIKDLQRQLSVKDKEIGCMQENMGQKDNEIGKIQADIKKIKINIKTNENNQLQMKNQNVSNIEALQLKNPKHPLHLSDVREFEVKKVYCKIKEPPKQVGSTHADILKVVKEKLSRNGYKLEDGETPILVTIVNASRGESDLSRDMMAANLTSTEYDNVVLLRIIPTDDQKKCVTRLRNFPLDLPFLTDDRGKLHDCENNTELCEELKNYLLNSD